MVLEYKMHLPPGRDAEPEGEEEARQEPSAAAPAHSSAARAARPDRSSQLSSGGVARPGSKAQGSRLSCCSENLITLSAALKVCALTR